MSYVRKEYNVTYNGSGLRTLSINPSELALARRGTRSAQVNLARLFFKRHGKGLPTGWKWSLLQLTPVDDQPKTPPNKDDTHGCTCDDDCPGCDQGHHRRCGRGCKYGQKMQG